jgi:hypothetical protein
MGPPKDSACCYGRHGRRTSAKGRSRIRCSNNHVSVVTADDVGNAVAKDGVKATPSPWARFPDGIGSLSIWVVGFALLWFVLTGLGALVSKHRRVKVVYAFCVALGSSYSASFVFNMIALAIQGDLPPKNIIWRVFTLLALAVMCLCQALFRGAPSCPLFWAHVVNGTVAVMPLFFAGHTFVTLFTALPLFGVAILLRSGVSRSVARAQTTCASLWRGTSRNRLAVCSRRSCLIWASVRC